MDGLGRPSSRNEMDAATLTSALKHEARRLGFALTGVCPAVTPQGIHHFRAWLGAGYAGEMTYLVERSDAYEHPRHVLDGVRSLLMLAMPYRTSEPGVAGAAQGRVSRYAWGTDYHDLIHERLRQLAAWLKGKVPECKARGVVDTAPL